MYIPGWLICVGILIAFFIIMVVSNQHEKEKRELEERIEELKADLAEKEEAEQTQHLTRR